MVVHMEKIKKYVLKVINIPLILATKSASREIGVISLKLDTERLQDNVQFLVRDLISQVIIIRIIITRRLTQIVQLPRENLVNFRLIWSALWKKSSGRLQITTILLPLKQQKMIIASRHWKQLLIPTVGRLELTQNHLELSNPTSQMIKKESPNSHLMSTLSNIMSPNLQRTWTILKQNLITLTLNLKRSKIRLPEIVTSWTLWLPIKRNLMKRLIMSLILNTKSFIDSIISRMKFQTWRKITEP